MLTRKQRELLKFIQERLGETGISPSFDEMKEALGLKSKSGVHRLITGLEERGFIKRLPHRARALDVVRLPEDQTAKAAQAAQAARAAAAAWAAARAYAPRDSRQERHKPMRSQSRFALYPSDEVAMGSWLLCVASTERISVKRSIIFHLSWTKPLMKCTFWLKMFGPPSRIEKRSGYVRGFAGSKAALLRPNV